MANHRLSDALIRSGWMPEQLAESLGVDGKTLQRWISPGRVPYRRHRQRISALLREPESYLWPDIVDHQERVAIGRSEIVELYPRRTDVRSDLWSRLVNGARDRVDVLLFAGLFSADQNATTVGLLADRAAAGVRLRILLGDPNARSTPRRGIPSVMSDASADQIRHGFAPYRTLADLDEVEVRLHDTPLSNSIYRFDDEMLVSLHVHGLAAEQSPLLHLRQLTRGELFLTYAGSFERVWSGAFPAWD